MPAIPILSSIADLEPRFDVWFLDIWGVLHNGVRPYADAVSACQAFRRAGGRVLLVSNSPRPHSGVALQLKSVGVADDAFDAILTSGDVSRRLIAGYAGASVFHLGPARDRPVFEGLDVTVLPAEFVADVAALSTSGTAGGNVPDGVTAVVCTGLFDDERETPDTYKPLLAAFKAHALDMVCVNPDVTVERGGRLIYCAGALAEAYQAIGGRVLFAGKPHRPIYDAALAMARDVVGRDVPASRILAIGDGAKTDIAGARDAGIAAVYVASGVSMARGEDLPSAALRLFPDPSRRPLAVMTALA
ncbi:MAG: HAD family hydrolase [Hyphomicrobium sp.]